MQLCDMCAIVLHDTRGIRFGIVCSTWVWISRSSTGRSGTNVNGNATPSVLSGNRMASRVMLLWWLCAARNIWCILEQPASSILHLQHRFQELIKKRTVWRTRQCLGLFGAESPKPVVLYSNKMYIGQLGRHVVTHKLPVSRGVTTVVVKDGSKKITGAAGLKDTQTYPKPLGVAVANVYLDNVQQTGNDKPVKPMATPDDPNAWDWLWERPDLNSDGHDGDPWLDALLQPVFDLLMNMAQCA